MRFPIPRLILLTMLILQGNTQIISQNIIFNKIGEVGVSRSTWKLNYILELSSYERLFTNSNRFLKNLQRASNRVQTLCIKKFIKNFTGDKEPSVPLDAMQEEILHPNRTKLPHNFRADHQ